MKVIFVGIHNKPGKGPLDSSTKTGAIIDSIIKNIQGATCVKSNLFNDLVIPPKTAHGFHWLHWIKTNYTPGDIVVLLGNDVVKHWPGTLPHENVLKFGHPAGLRFTKVTAAEYIENTSFEINTLIGLLTETVK